MLKIENLKIAPEESLSALTAQAAKLLKVREKDFSSLRVLRRSVDAREEVSLVYTVEEAVKDEAAVLKRCRSKKVSQAARRPGYLLPAPLPAPDPPPVARGSVCVGNVQSTTISEGVPFTRPPKAALR